MEGINITVNKVGALKDIALVRVRGYVDTTTSPELQKTLSNSINGAVSQFIIDLGAVNYVSSAGWGVFVGEIRDLREKGGDLKFIQMTPEVMEVFEMLEFNRILTCYDSLEEAIFDFDYCRGLDLKAASNSFSDTLAVQTATAKRTAVAAEVPPPTTHPKIEMAGTPRSSMYARHRSVDDSELPLTEKIKKLALESPAIGPWSIKKLLYSPRFGYTKIGYFKLRSVMRKLGLDSKTKRYRYFRSR